MMLEKFIQMLNSLIGHIYVWGGQGQAVVSEAQIRNMETSTTNADRAIALYRLRKQTMPVVRMFDCSGLGIYILMALGLITYDTNANGMYGLCKKIARADIKVGDWVFRRYMTGINIGRMYHIGYVVAIENGVPIVIEAMGRDDGVVRRSLNASGTAYWNAYGRPNMFEAEILNYTEGETMLQKGDKGQAVYDYQVACKKAGYDVGAWGDMVLRDAAGAKIPTGCDGSFGDKMVTVTTAIQAKHGLPQTGVVDAATYGRLASELMGKLVDTSALTAQVNNLMDRIGGITNANAALQNKINAALAALK
jgi:hypothetical protein